MIYVSCITFFGRGGGSRKNWRERKRERKGMGSYDHNAHSEVPGKGVPQRRPRPSTIISPLLWDNRLLPFLPSSSVAHFFLHPPPLPPIAYQSMIAYHYLNSSVYFITSCIIESMCPLDSISHTDFKKLP